MTKTKVMAATQTITSAAFILTIISVSPAQSEPTSVRAFHAVASKDEQSAKPKRSARRTVKLTSQDQVEEIPLPAGEPLPAGAMPFDEEGPHAYGDKGPWPHHYYPYLPQVVYPHKDLKGTYEDGFVFHGKTLDEKFINGKNGPCFNGKCYMGGGPPPPINNGCVPPPNNGCVPPNNDCMPPPACPPNGCKPPPPYCKPPVPVCPNCQAKHWHYHFHFHGKGHKKYCKMPPPREWIGQRPAKPYRTYPQATPYPNQFDSRGGYPFQINSYNRVPQSTPAFPGY